MMMKAIWAAALSLVLLSVQDAGAAETLHLAAHYDVQGKNANGSRYSGVVALGCVIRGETYHFEVVSDNANHWLMDVATRHCVPVGNGILTVENEKQAMERAEGGRKGKGGDAARACLRLVDLVHQFQGQGA